MLMPTIPFTPPHVSVNRVRIVDLPGLPLDAEVRAQAAYHLLSKEAVVHYALEQASALGLPEALLLDTPEARRDIPLYVDTALHASDAVARAAAAHIAVRLGRNLAYILLALHRGDACNRAVRPDWTAVEWDFWAGIRAVWLGGGVLSGMLGERVIAQAQALLSELGYADVLQVALSPYRREMSLLGAGRYAPAEAAAVLCFDFGQTMVKRARLRLHAGAIAALEPLPALATNWIFHNDPTAAQRYSGEEVLAFVADLFARTLEETGVTEGDLMVSIAAYVDGGRLLGNGIYARMSELMPDVRPLLAEAVRVRCGRAVRVHLIHDGTAAAALHAGEAHAAVLVAGTALGVGFCPPDATDLRPLRLELGYNKDRAGAQTTTQLSGE